MPGETIERAALRTPAGVVYDLPKPGRHHDVIAAMSGLGVDAWDCDQGFTTSTGRYVDRFEAMDIARTAGQLIPQHADEDGVTYAREPSDRLFSEDVW